MLQLNAVPNTGVSQNPHKQAYEIAERIEPVYKSFYGPDTLRMMGIAFDRAWKLLFIETANKESVRRMLARRIILLVDSGERGAMRLAVLATAEFRR